MISSWLVGPTLRHHMANLLPSLPEMLIPRKNRAVQLGQPWMSRVFIGHNWRCMLRRLPRSSGTKHWAVKWVSTILTSLRMRCTWWLKMVSYIPKRFYFKQVNCYTSARYIELAYIHINTCVKLSGKKTVKLASLRQRYWWLLWSRTIGLLSVSLFMMRIPLARLAYLEVLSFHNLNYTRAVAHSNP